MPASAAMTYATAAGSAVLTNELLQRYKPHVRLAAYARAGPRAAGVGLAVVSGTLGFVAWKKMNDGAPKGAAVGAAVAGVLTGIMDAAGLQ